MLDAKMPSLKDKINAPKETIIEKVVKAVKKSK